jgi:TrmH family RNA methyltransferase
VSLTKAELKYLRSLSQKKVREAERRFVLEGWRALKEALNSPATIDLVAVLARFLTDPDYGKILAQLRQRRIPVKEIKEAELKSIADSVHSQGVVAVIQKPQVQLDDRWFDRASLVIAADAVADPGNVGSIVRSADWFGVDLVLLGKGCVDLYNEKVVRSTVGSIFHVPVGTDIDLPTALRQLKKAGFDIITLSSDGKKTYAEQVMGEKTVYVLGSEAHGVSQDVRALSNTTVRIPKYGKAESLNVGVVCGIMLSYVRTTMKSEKVN